MFVIVIIFVPDGPFKPTPLIVSKADKAGKAYQGQTLAYYKHLSITDVKSFIEFVPARGQKFHGVFQVPS
jgi:hypothetical protein